MANPNASQWEPGFIQDLTPGPYDTEIKTAFGAGTPLGYVGAQVDVQSLIDQSGSTPASFGVTLLEENMILTGEAYTFGLALAKSADLTQPWEVILQQDSGYAGYTYYFGANGDGLQALTGDGYDTLIVVFDQSMGAAKVMGMTSAAAASAAAAQSAAANQNPLTQGSNAIASALKPLEDSISKFMESTFKAEATAAFFILILIAFLVWETEFRHPEVGRAGAKAAVKAAEVT